MLRASLIAMTAIMSACGFMIPQAGAAPALRNHGHPAPAAHRPSLHAYAARPVQRISEPRNRVALSTPGVGHRFRHHAVGPVTLGSWLPWRYGGETTVVILPSAPARMDRPRGLPVVAGIRPAPMAAPVIYRIERGAATGAEPMSGRHRHGVNAHRMGAQPEARSRNRQAAASTDTTTPRVISVRVR